jgi:hypothetical protein
MMPWAHTSGKAVQTPLLFFHLFADVRCSLSWLKYSAFRS